MSGEQEDKGFWDDAIRSLCSVKHGICCCGKLRTGTLMIGWTYVILSTLSLVSWLKEGVGPSPDALRKTSIGDNTDHDHFGDRITPAVYSLFMALEAAASAGLLVGVYTNNLKLVKIWIEVFLISFFAGIIWEIFKYGVQTFLGEARILFFFSVVLFLLILKPFQFWKIVVVKSYYVQESDG